MSLPCQPTDVLVQGLVGHIGHLLSIDLKECHSVTDQTVHAVARRCPSLINIRLGAAHPIGPEITDVALQSIAHSCTQLVSIDLEDAALGERARKSSHLHAEACSSHRSAVHMSLQLGQ